MDTKPKKRNRREYAKAHPRKRVNTPRDLERLRNYQRELRLQNPELVREKRQAWRKLNPDKVRAALKRQAHSQKTKERQQRNSGIVCAVKLFYGCQNPACPCTHTLPSYCLDCHHVSGPKKFNLGSGGKNKSLLTLASEMRKCTVLCAVCHRMEKWGELDCATFKKCNVTDDCVPT